MSGHCATYRTAFPRRQFIWPRLRRRFLWLALLAVFCQAVLPYFAAAQCPELVALSTTKPAVTATAHCGMGLAAAKTPASGHTGTHALPTGCALCASLALFGQAMLAGPPLLSLPLDIVQADAAVRVSLTLPGPPAAAFAARAPPTRHRFS